MKKYLVWLNCLVLCACGNPPKQEKTIHMGAFHPKLVITEVEVDGVTYYATKASDTGWSLLPKPTPTAERQ